MNVKLLRKIQKQILAKPESFTMWYPEKCVAGWACRLSGIPMNRCYAESSCVAKATELLDITKPQADLLFYQYFKTDEPIFADAWGAPSKKRAELMAERIDVFIETKGTK
jgi:hypothetical protein